MYVYFMVTRKCNCSCSFCIRHNLQSEINSDISLESFKNVVDSLSGVYANATLVITGGEPFLYENWDLLVQYAMDKFRSIVLPSNGTFGTSVREKLRKFLRRNVYLQLSLDGVSAIHDKIRGMGVFNSVIQNLTELKDVSEKIVLSSTVGIRNMERICELAVFLNSFRFRHWKISLEQVERPGQDPEINFKEWNELVDRILQLCAFEVHIKKQFDFALMDKAIANGGNFNLVNRNCGFGKNKIYVDSSLNVYPCSCIDLKVGNLKNDSAISLKEKLEVLGNIIPSESSPCFTCKYQKFCNGGCPGYSYKYFGRLDMGDIRCPIVMGCCNEKH